MTGTLEAMMCSTIPRVESNSPPGVLSSISTAAAFCFSACAIARSMYSCVIGLIVLSIRIRTTCCALKAGAMETVKRVAKMIRVSNRCREFIFPPDCLTSGQRLLRDNIPLQRGCGCITRLQRQCLVRALFGGIELIVLQIEPAQHNIRISRGLKLQRSLSLFPGSRGISFAFCDPRQPGMGPGIRRIPYYRLSELPLGICGQSPLK